MAEERDLEADYGGPYTDARPVTNPETDQSATFKNRTLEDMCHLTRTPWRFRINFTSRNSNGDCTVNAFKSHWGSTVDTETVSRTATGEYTATVKSSYTDDLGVSETISLYDAQVEVYSSDKTDNLFARILAISSNSVTFIIESPKGTLADFGDQSAEAVTGVIRLA